MAVRRRSTFAVRPSSADFAYEPDTVIAEPPLPAEPEWIALPGSPPAASPAYLARVAAARALLGRDVR